MNYQNIRSPFKDFKRFHNSDYICKQTVERLAKLQVD